MKARESIETLILTVRGQKVILDADLAELYGVPTKALNRAVKRNIHRFPEDFVFLITKEEQESLRCQIGTAKVDLKSQTVTSRRGGRRTPPYAFTEHGAIMAATVLNSPEAVSMSVYVVRAFVQMREQIAANSEILKRLAEIDRTLLQHDEALQILWAQLQPLLTPPSPPEKTRIGFNAKRP